MQHFMTWACSSWRPEKESMIRIPPTYVRVELCSSVVYCDWDREGLRELRDTSSALKVPFFSFTGYGKRRLNCWIWYYGFLAYTYNKFFYLQLSWDCFQLNIVPSLECTIQNFLDQSAKKVVMGCQKDRRGPRIYYSNRSLRADGTYRDNNFQNRRNTSLAERFLLLDRSKEPKLNSASGSAAA